MIANLGMYAAPRLQARNIALWDAIHKNLTLAGIQAPEHLSDIEEGPDLWLSPDLVFSQTCGLPLRTFLKNKVTLIGTPDYGLDDCPAGYYYSYMITHADNPKSSIEQFQHSRWCANAFVSQSGFAAALETADQNGIEFNTPNIVGAHANSIKAVQEKSAEFAFVDAVTWRMISASHDLSHVKIITQSPARPGLPFITRIGQNRDVYFDCINNAINSLGQDTPLGMRKLVDIPWQDYLVIPIPQKTQESLKT